MLARPARYRPISPDGLPIIGAIPDTSGTFVATWHSVWAMLNVPATGKALSELILDGRASSVPLNAFDPARFTS